MVVGLYAAVSEDEALLLTALVSERTIVRVTANVNRTHSSISWTQTQPSIRPPGIKPRPV